MKHNTVIEQLIVGPNILTGMVKFRPRVLYASDKKNKGLVTFLEIDRDSMSLKNIIIPNASCPLSLPLLELKESGQDISGNTANAVEKWLNEHADVKLSLAGPGARMKNKMLKKCFVADKGKVWGVDSDGICAVSALVNEVAVLVDTTTEEVMLAEW